MAKKTYLVIDGALQEGRTTYVKGDQYTPPDKELEAELLKAGKIAPLGSREAAQVQSAATSAAQDEAGAQAQPPAQDDD